MIAAIVRETIRLFALFLTGAKAYWFQESVAQELPNKRGKIYYANHNSHGDFVLLWACLPKILRKQVRPVAGEDYWGKTKFRRFIIIDVFNGVLIARNSIKKSQQTSEKAATLLQEPSKRNPLQPMLDALDAGDSIIIFPEGTRNLTQELLLPFKSGLYHLSQARPDAELIPVWLANLGRIFPKGSWLPLPLLCTVHFGTPLAHKKSESKSAFLTRAYNELLNIYAPFKHNK